MIVDGRHVCFWGSSLEDMSHYDSLVVGGGR